MASHLGLYTFKYKADADLIKATVDKCVRDDQGRLCYDIPYVKVSVCWNTHSELGYR